MPKPRNCIICGKPVPLIKGMTRTQAAKICRATMIGGVNFASECQKAYRNKWHANHYAAGKTKPKIIHESDTARSCLKCDEPFPSKGPYNRICEPCGKMNEFIGPTAKKISKSTGDRPPVYTAPYSGAQEHGGT